MNTEIQHKTATTLTQAKRLIVKVGSSLLMQGKDGSLNTAWMATLGEDLAAACARSRCYSGLIRCDSAWTRMSWSLRCTFIFGTKSGRCSCGTNFSGTCLARGAESPRHDNCADSPHSRRYRAKTPLSECKKHTNALLDLGAVPVINENDTVATQEIRYGDNDRLAARVTSMVSGDCLVLLSDIDGLYSDADRIGMLRPILRRYLILHRCTCYGRRKCWTFWERWNENQARGSSNSNRCRRIHDTCEWS